MIAQARKKARLGGQLAPRLAPKMRVDPSTLVPQVSDALPLVIKFARDSPLERRWIRTTGSAREWLPCWAFVLVYLIELFGFYRRTVGGRKLPL